MSNFMRFIESQERSVEKLEERQKQGMAQWFAYGGIHFALLLAILTTESWRPFTWVFYGCAFSLPFIVLKSWLTGRSLTPLYHKFNDASGKLAQIGTAATFWQLFWVFNELAANIFFGLSLFVIAIICFIPKTGSHPSDTDK